MFPIISSFESIQKKGGQKIKKTESRLCWLKTHQPLDMLDSAECNLLPTWKKRDGLKLGYIRCRIIHQEVDISGKDDYLGEAVTDHLSAQLFKSNNGTRWRREQKQTGCRQIGAITYIVENWVGVGFMRREDQLVGSRTVDVPLVGRGMRKMRLDFFFRHSQINIRCDALLRRYVQGGHRRVSALRRNDSTPWTAVLHSTWILIISTVKMASILIWKLHRGLLRVLSRTDRVRFPISSAFPPIPALIKFLWLMLSGHISSSEEQCWCRTSRSASGVQRCPWSVFMLREALT